MTHRAVRPAALTGLALCVVAGLVVTPLSAATAAPSSPRGLTEVGEVAAGLPLLGWSAVATADHYEVQVDDADDFSSPSFDVDTDNVSVSSPTALPAGTQHWRVRAVDATGLLSAWSSASFEVDLTASPSILPAVPGEPQLLRWSAVPGAATYVVQLDDEDRFTAAREYPTQSTSLVVPDVLDPDKPYFWRVKAVRSTTVESAYSASSTFTVPPLPAPVIVTPDDSPTNDLTDVVLDWEPVPGARYYDLQVSTDDAFGTIVDTKTNLVGTRFSPAVTYDNNQYFWRVRAVYDSTHKSDWSPELGQFRRSWSPVDERPETASFKPEAVYPLSTSDDVGDPFFFQWTPVAHAALYQLQVAQNPSFNDSRTCLTASTTYTPGAFRATDLTRTLQQREDERCNPSPGVVNYWRVRPLDTPYQQPNTTIPGVQGVFSEPQAFLYEPADFTPQPGGQLFSPRPGQTVDVPTFTWTPDEDSTTYRVTVTNAAGSSVASDTTYATSFTPTAALPTSGNPYQWSVMAVEADGSPGSLTYLSKFNVSGNTGTDSPLSALSGTGSSLRAPSLAWGPDPSASYYRVQVYYHDTTTIVPGTELTNGTTKLYSPAVTDTSTAFLPAGSYDWVVTSYNASNAALSSAKHTFSIDALEPVAIDVDGDGYDDPADGDDFPRWALDGQALREGRGCGTTLGTEADLCADAPSTPVFAWRSVPGASYYVLYLGQDDKFTNLVEPATALSGTSNTYWTPTASALHTALPDSQAGASYFLFVRPCKAPGFCARSPISVAPSMATNKFRKKSPVITGAVADTATGDGSEVTFTWDDYRTTNAATTWAPTGESPHQSAKTYRLEVSNVPSFATTLSSVVIDQPTYTATTRLYPDGPLYWRVRAIDGDANELSLSPTYPFAKTSPRVDAVSPSDGDVVQGSTPFRWEAQPYAKEYQLEVAANNDQNFTNPLFSVRSLQTSYTWSKVIPASDQPYVWRVRRIDSSSPGNPGQWSAPRSFHSAGAVPSLTLPPAGAVVPASRALFYWTLVPGATQYRVEITGSSSFTTAGNTYAPTTPFRTGTTQWRVVALDANRATVGTTAWRAFSVDATAPTVVRTSSTSNLSRTGKITVTFSEPVTGVSTSSVKLVKRGTTKVVRSTISVTSSKRAFTLTPRSRLAAGTSYELRLSASIRDRQGNALTPRTVYVTTRR